MDGLKLNGIAFDTPMNLLSGPNRVSTEDEYLKLYPKKTLFDLGEEKEEGVFVVFATIAHVIDDDNWWYPACKCHKSVTADNGMYYCSACRKHVFFVIPRFKVKFEALDDSDVANLVMFDYDVAYLLKKTCSELLARLKEESLGGGVPDEFDALVGKKLLFKVTKNASWVSTFGDTYRVAGVCDDEHIISTYELNGPDFSPLKASLNSSVDSVINLAEESPICGDAKKDFVSSLLVDFSSGSDPIPSDTIESSFCKRILKDDYEGVCCGSSKSIRIVDVEKKEKVPN
ncbi:hypothetical protein RIF29_28938 [Crotalaria pallida]|uniref:Replication factor A C-terminal domain-containing protein n=1 Tax=Crotalaria pallida TaxID=3830 RepID=A0AAN9EIT8_CROPI